MDTTQYKTKKFQQILIEVLLTDANIFVLCRSILKAEYFHEFKKIMQFILDYTDEYSQLPMIELVNTKSKDTFSLLNKEDVIRSKEFLVKQIEHFCKTKALELVIQEAPDLIANSNHGELEKKIKDAVLISLNKDLGLLYHEDPKERIEKLRKGNNMVSTGFKDLDYKLFGGVNRGEMTIFAGSSGSGKSIFLQNFSIQFIKQGLDVIYFSYELSQELVAQRIDMIMTERTSSEIFTYTDDVHNEIKIKFKNPKYGNLRIKYFPSGTKANDLKSYIREYEIQLGKKPDALIIDYLDLMHPNNSKLDISNPFNKDKWVAEEVRNLVIEMRCLCITASQLNRCLTLDTIVNINGINTEIKNIKVGDKILSNEGYNEVLEVLPIQKQQVYKIKTKSGKEIKVSSKHLFPTNRGLTNIENGLVVGDKLFGKN